MNKKALIIQNVIYIVLNLAFGLAMMSYISSSLGNSYVHEQALAKQIGLLIDEAKPGTTFTINLEEEDKLVKTAEQKSRIVQIKGNKVVVSLGSKEGYAFEFFTDAKISSKIENKFLIIKMEKR
jgi:predicted nucleic-acid-binding Zn-ribbon protein